MGILNNIFKKTAKQVSGESKEGKVEGLGRLVKPAKTIKKKKIRELTKEPAKRSVETKAAIAKSGTSRKSGGRAGQIIIKPLITEKVTDLNIKNKYVFAVAPQVNKIMITQAITDLYKVKPIAVNIINLRGKRVRYGRIRGKQKSWKKAIVTLKQGETIKVHDI